MAFSVVDYAHCLSASGASGKVHPGCSGKFVQIRNNHAEYLVFSLTASTPYHANIAERFLGEHGVSGRYNAKRDFFGIEEEGWSITGGGMWQINVKGKTLKLSGSSQAYGRFEAGGIEEKIRTATGLKEFRIVVE